MTYMMELLYVQNQKNINIKYKKYAIGAKHSIVTFQKKKKEKLHLWLVYANY